MGMLIMTFPSFLVTFFGVDRCATTTGASFRSAAVLFDKTTSPIQAWHGWMHRISNDFDFLRFKIDRYVYDVCGFLRFCFFPILYSWLEVGEWVINVIMTYLRVFQLVHIQLRFNLQCSLHLHDCQRIREKQSHHFHVDPYWIPIGPSCKPRVQRAPNRGCGDDNQKIKMWKKNMGYPSKHIISCYFNIMLCIVVMLVIVMVMRRMNTCCMGLGWLLVVVSSHYGWFYGKWQVFYFLHMYAHTFFGYIQYWHPWHLFNKLSLVLRRAPPRVGLSPNGMPTENHQQKKHGKMQTTRPGNLLHSYWTWP